MRPADRLTLVLPTREPPLGLSLLGVDLGAFFVSAREVGPGPALALLAARALALRRRGAVSFHDLGWVLGLRRSGVLQALRRLSDAGAVVWHEEVGRGVVAVEVVGDIPGARPLFGPEDTPPFLTHALPTHWFVQVLPLVGRRAFLGYLYLRSRERRDGFTPPLLVSALVRACRLRWQWQGRRLLRQLERRHLVIPVGGRRYAVLDPRPPTALQRRYLRLLEVGALPPTRAARAAFLAAALGLPLLLLLTLALL